MSNPEQGQGKEAHYLCPSLNTYSPKDIRWVRQTKMSNPEQGQGTEAHYFAHPSTPTSTSTPNFFVCCYPFKACWHIHKGGHETLKY